MGWNIRMRSKEGETLQSNKSIEYGSTYQLGGTNEMDMRLTYNYSQLYHAHLDEQEGLSWLHNKTGREAKEKLQAAVNELGTDKSQNYWAVTPGNAGFALSILLSWAIEQPDGIFEIAG